jgi:FkbM family methyltransferase
LCGNLLKEVYEVATKNIELNNLNDKIILINKGVSAEKEILEIQYDNIDSTVMATSKKGSLIKQKVETTTLKDIIKEFNLLNPFLLKIDCEGCENDIILNSDLSMFQEVILEYHTFLTGVKYTKLIEKLKEDGFDLVYHKGDNSIEIIHMKNNSKSQNM